MSSYPSNTSDTREAGKTSEAGKTREAGKVREAGGTSDISEAGKASEAAEPMPKRQQERRPSRARGSNTGLAYYCPVHRIIECPCVRSHVYS